MIPAQYASVFEKLGFSITDEGHEFDAAKHDLLARHASELAALEQEYDALATTKKPAKIMNILRFSTGGSDRQDASARHHEYAANKHREGKNAWNPFGGMLTPSSHEVGGTSGLGGSFGAAKPKIKKASYGDPDYDIDSREVALDQVEANRKDSKATLTGLFDNAKNVEKHQTKTISKALPEKGKMERDTGNPLLKVAASIHGMPISPTMGKAMRVAMHPATMGAATGISAGALGGGIASEKGHRVSGAIKGGLAGGALGGLGGANQAREGYKITHPAIKLASPHYRAVMRLALKDELQRISEI